MYQQPFQPPVAPPPGRHPLRTMFTAAAVTVGVVLCVLAAGFTALVVREMTAEPTAAATPTHAVLQVPTRLPTALTRPTATVPAALTPSTAAATTATTGTPLRELVLSAYRRDDGPFDVTLTHALNNTIKSRLANIDPQRDLTLRATFLNPYGAAERDFDFGFMFRGAPQGRYALVILSDQTYRLDIVRGTAWTAVSSGQLSGMRVGAGERNTVVLEANGSSGVLTMNDVVQARLNLADHQVPGSASVAIGMYLNKEREGAVTQVEDFSVRGRDEPAPLTVLLRETFVTTNTDFTTAPYSDRNGLLERTIADGVYRFDYRTLAGSLIRTESTAALTNDFAVAVTSRLVQATADSGETLAVQTGLAVRLSRDADGNLSHYLFQVAADGSAASFYLYQNGEWTKLLEVADPPYVVGQANQLAVVVRGQRYRCFINGDEVLSLSHVALSGGTTALTLEVGGAGHTLVTFDDFEVRVGP